MARKGFTEEQIIGVLKQADAGAKTADLCRQHGIWDRVRMTQLNNGPENGGTSPLAAVR